MPAYARSKHFGITKRSDVFTDAANSGLFVKLKDSILIGGRLRKFLLVSISSVCALMIVWFAGAAVKGVVTKRAKLASIIPGPAAPVAAAAIELAPAAHSAVIPVSFFHRIANELISLNIHSSLHTTAATN